MTFCALKSQAAVGSAAIGAGGRIMVRLYQRVSSVPE